MKNHIYILDTTFLDDEERFCLYYRQMSENRRKKIDAFRFMKDKKLSLGAGILLRESLMYAGVTDIRLEYNKNEKPFLIGEDNIFFNLSHSGKMAVCAVSDRTVGVDIEEEQHFEDSFLHYTCFEEEVKYIHTNAESIDRSFTELWTIKESIMKFFGTGISLEPNKISIDMNSSIKASCESLDTSGLHFTQYKLSGYALTVCSEYENFADELEWIYASNLHIR